VLDLKWYCRASVEAGVPRRSSNLGVPPDQVAIESLSGLGSLIESGMLRPLAVASAHRLLNYPYLPTVAEAVPSFGTFEARGWFALMAPAGTPERIVRKVNADLPTALTD